VRGLIGYTWSLAWCRMWLLQLSIAARVIEQMEAEQAQNENDMGFLVDHIASLVCPTPQATIDVLA
jgi:hypothetical protein